MATLTFTGRDRYTTLRGTTHADPENANMSDIVDTLLALAEAQARIIATMDLRIQTLEGRRR
ncbi:hypothetical protein [Microbacterium paraoxydans]|uniref:hypothetical protein n=1 Tax=Microbacterium paraoxydans TaxID=199592 RepID=UPI003013DB51